MFPSQNIAQEKIKNIAVMPAKARSAARWYPENAIKTWMPAFAGMTEIFNSSHDKVFVNYNAGRFAAVLSDQLALCHYKNPGLIVVKYYANSLLI
jgi:hypothetical protein